MPRKAAPLRASAIAETLSPRTRKSLQRDERVGGAGLDGRRTRRAGSRRRRTAPSTSAEPQPAASVRMTPQTSASRPRGAEDGAGEVEPARAPRAALGDEASAWRRARSTATGTLTKKIHSQPSESTSTPPATTPSVPPMPASAPQTPSAMLRSRPAGNVTVSSASAAGESSAAPMPWIARTAISASEEPAKPPASEAAREQRRGRSRKSRRRPSRSLIAAAEQEQAAEGERVAR